MNIVNSVQDPTVALACQLVSKHYKDEEFIDIVRGVRSYSFTFHSPARVAEKIANLKLNFEVLPYATKAVISPVIGYTNYRAGKIYVNTHNLDQTLCFRMGNIMHEAMHLLGYAHLTNKNWWYNRRSVPYMVGDLLGEFVVKNFPEECVIPTETN